MAYPLTVAIDLDGTLAEYDGWKGEPHIGEPISGAVDACRSLVDQGWTVYVFSARKEHRFVDSWLRFYEFPPEVRVWTEPGKPPAHVYVDDRAVRFRSWRQAMIDLKAIQMRGGVAL